MQWRSAAPKAVVAAMTTSAAVGGARASDAIRMMCAVERDSETTLATKWTNISHASGEPGVSAAVRRPKRIPPRLGPVRALHGACAAPPALFRRG
jgi:hypothetical protein